MLGKACFIALGMHLTGVADRVRSRGSWVISAVLLTPASFQDENTCRPHGLVLVCLNLPGKTGANKPPPSAAFPSTLLRVCAKTTPSNLTASISGRLAFPKHLFLMFFPMVIQSRA
jgi:hypothetical protein